MLLILFTKWTFNLTLWHDRNEEFRVFLFYDGMKISNPRVGATERRRKRSKAGREKTINWKGKRNLPIKRKPPPLPRSIGLKAASLLEIPLRAGPRPQYLTEFIRHCWMAAVVKMITDDPWASLALTGNEVRSALAGCPRMPGPSPRPCSPWTTLPDLHPVASPSFLFPSR